jgi:ketosteroid isomerase-like protein
MDNPLGGIKRGWPEIRGVYERIFQGRATFSFEFYDYTIYEVGDVFYALGRERGRYEVGGSALKLAIRTTRVFRKVDGRWRQFHHHGSIDDPEMLKAYQKAVFGG